MLEAREMVLLSDSLDLDIKIPKVFTNENTKSFLCASDFQFILSYEK